MGTQRYNEVFGLGSRNKAELDAARFEEAWIASTLGENERAHGFDRSAQEGLQRSNHLLDTLSRGASTGPFGLGGWLRVLNTLGLAYVALTSEPKRSDEAQALLAQATRTCRRMLVHESKKLRGMPKVIRGLDQIGAAALLCYTVWVEEDDNAAEERFFSAIHTLTGEGGLKPQFELLERFCGHRPL